jgi:hypothetical protein
LNSKAKGISNSDDFSLVAADFPLAGGALGLFFSSVVLLEFGAADMLTTSAAASSPTGHLRLEPLLDFSGSFSIENIPFLKALLPVLEIPLEIPDSACKLNMPSLVAILESKSPNKAYTTLNYRP